MKRPIARCFSPLIIIALVWSGLPAAAAEFKGAHWVFQAGQFKDAAFKDQLGNWNAALEGRAEFERQPAALKLDGKTLLTAPGVKVADLPRQTFSAAAWVRLRQGTQWGGIVGHLQDNGDDEHGWLLGYDDSRFYFAVSTKGKLTYLKAAEPFDLERWHYVAGTYDGQTMRLYVDGKEQATSTAQSGPISYKPSVLAIGGYKDQNEDFRMLGDLAEVRLYSQVLSPEQVKAEFAKRQDDSPPPFELAFGPYVQFTGQREAIVRWRTSAPSPSILCYGERDPTEHSLEDAQPKTDHEMTVADLRHNVEYVYVIKQRIGDKPSATREYKLETFFNYRLPDIPEHKSPFAKNEFYAEQAAEIIKRTGAAQGYCLDLGCGDGRLAYELARQSNLRVIGVDTDAENVAAARKALRQAGLYGARVTIRQVSSLDELPFARATFNRIVSRAALDGKAAPADEAIRRLLTPNGSACLGPFEGVPPNQSFLRTVRPAPTAGAGNWTHQYGAPDNAAFSRETLGGASGVDELEVRWIGRPGPRAMVDRNPRTPAPLAANGRLFVQGLERIVALDSANGAILWSLEIPGLGRFNMPRDGGNWCTGGDAVFLAHRGQCWEIDAATGALRQTHDARPASLEDQDYHWGYVARDAEFLIGSAVKADAPYADYWGKQNWYDGKGGEYGTHKVCSDNLFALKFDEPAGKPAWQYANGVILNPTITIADGRVYFLECRNAKIKNAQARRLEQPELWQDLYLTALNGDTGAKLWERELKDVKPGTVSTYLAYAAAQQGNADSPGTLVLATSSDRYYLYTFDAKDGRPRWQTDQPWPSDNHSGHLQHPAIANGKVFLEPCVYRLSDGKLLAENMGRHEGCATYAATTNALIYRGRARQVGMWDVDSGRVTAWKRLRPACWLSTIPAHGLVLSPEAGGGCSCGNWLETSLAFAPVDCLPPRCPTEQGLFHLATKAALSAPQPAAEIRYTLDDSDPTAQSTQYAAPIFLDRTATLRARAFLPDGAKSAVAAFRFERATLREPDAPDALAAGLRCQYYEGQWKILPDFKTLTAKETGVAKRIDLSLCRRKDNAGLQLSGYVEAPRDGVCTFYLRADDGAVLWIGDRLVVNNDGRHAAWEKSGKIGLKAGRHAIRVGYFQTGSDRFLSASYTGPELPKQEIPANALWHAKVNDEK